MKLLNMGAAAMAVLPLVGLTIQGIIAIDNRFNGNWMWAPLLTLVVLVSIAVYDWSRRWIARHESYQQVAAKPSTIPREPELEKIDI